MNIDTVIQKIGEVGIVPVVRAASVKAALNAVQAICAGGIPILEITMTVPNAISIIAELTQQHGDGNVLIGAGTVTSPNQAELCIRAGATFIVSPGLSTEVLASVRTAGVLAIPGALTPTELMNARENGAPLVKIFPCGSLGGPKYLRSLLAPFPDACLIPTGGVSATNAAEYIAAGAFALGVGADLVDAHALQNGNLQKITSAAQELVAIITAARSGAAVAKADGIKA